MAPDIWVLQTLPRTFSMLFAAGRTKFTCPGHIVTHREKLRKGFLPPGFPILNSAPQKRFAASCPHGAGEGEHSFVGRQGPE